MSGSTTLLDQISGSQAQKEVVANANFAAVSQASIYARHESACAGLTWAYYGGVIDVAGTPTEIANGTLTLTGSATCYIRKLDSTGAVSFVTSAPSGWPAPNGGYTPLYEAVTSSSGVLSWKDWRLGVGVRGATGGGGATGSTGSYGPTGSTGTAATPGGYFGDGSDGPATCDGSTSVPWGSLSVMVYTMDRNVYATDINISSGVTIKTNGFQLYVSGTVTGADATSVIDRSGNNASTSTGGAALAAGLYPAGVAGANGQLAAGSNAATPLDTALGGSGAAGGAGASGAGGTRTVCNEPTAAQGSLHGASVLTAQLTGQTVGATPTPYNGGGGGGGGGGDGSNKGGGGGSGAGLLAAFVRAFAGTGKLRSKGGNGANGTGGNSGGGGAGGGGAIQVATTTMASWTTDVTAGTPGNGVGTGANGNTASAGNAFVNILS